MLKKYNVWKKVYRYRILLLSGLISFGICLWLMTMFFSRSYAIGILKSKFDELEKNLQSIGYDFAYDNLRFYSFSPWQIMRIKNFRIYSLDEKDFVQWTTEELNVDVGLFNRSTVDIYLGSQQNFQVNKRIWRIFLPGADIQLRLKNDAAKEINLSVKDIQIENLCSVKTLSLHAKHQQTPYLSWSLDVQGVDIDDMTGWPLNKHISHIYLDNHIQGNVENDVLLSEAFYDWVDKGGEIVVQKAILNWKPLIMVANGHITFNENADPVVSLNTASLAMLETLDRLSENKYVSNKGTFVAKILLGNKAVQQNVTDKYKTVVTPLKISKDGVILENIKIR
ncbi:MAG: DUF2125 domain-containing protein [Alphaproteobacteria bacterium]|nr:DUF2125 domain-containing protein [Alphaproteobacteria bacterium]